MLKRITAILATIAAIGSFAVATSHGAPSIEARLVGNHPENIGTLQQSGDADPGQTLTMQIRFAIRDRKQLEQLLKDQHDPASRRYHQWLKRGEFAEKFGPRPAEVNAVARWLRIEGFSIVTASRSYIEFTGPVAMAERAFSVRIAKYGTGSAFANATDPVIPARFSDVIGSIVGLDNMTAAVPASTPHKLRTITSPVPSRSHKEPSAIAFSSDAISPDFILNDTEGFGPQDVRTFYDETVGSGSDGSGGCIAIVGTSDVHDATLSAFASQFSLPAFSLTRVIPNGGANPGIVSASPFGQEQEAELDLEYSHAVAPGAAQKFYITNSNNQIVDDLTQAIDDNTCDAINVSFTLCSSSNSTFTGTLDPLFMKAAGQGQSVFISSGDDGAAGLMYEANKNTCVVGTTQNVNEMSADQYVTAVGGTQFSPTYDMNGDVVGYTSEDVWNISGGASGGGASQIFGKPIYQTGPGVPTDNHRYVPDIALMGAFGTPGVFLADDQGSTTSTISCCFGGTSLSAPLWAGFSRVLSEQAGSRVGPMNPTIYALANQQYGPGGSAKGFHDVTFGNNNFNGVTGFAAGTGYDQSTGWGTIDFNAFAAVVKTFKATATPTATATATATATSTSTASATATRTATATATPTATGVATPTGTGTPTATTTAVATATATEIATATNTANATPTATLTQVATPTATATVVATQTATATMITMAPTPTPTPEAIVPRVAPARLVFPKTKVGKFSGPKRVAIVNTSKTLALGFKGPFIADTCPSSPCDYLFGTTPSTCPTGIIPPRKSCTFFIFFTPLATGPRPGSVTIYDNSLTGPHVIPLQGTGK